VAAIALPLDALVLDEAFEDVLAEGVAQEI